MVKGMWEIFAEKSHRILTFWPNDWYGKINDFYSANFELVKDQAICILWELKYGNNNFLKNLYQLPHRNFPIVSSEEKRYVPFVNIFMKKRNSQKRQKLSNY